MPPLTFPDRDLSDGVVSLRAWTRSDAERRFAAFSDPLCQEHSWSLLRPYERADAEATFARDEDARLGGEAIRLRRLAGDPELQGTVLTFTRLQSLGARKQEGAHARHLAVT